VDERTAEGTAADDKSLLRSATTPLDQDEECDYKAYTTDYPNQRLVIHRYSPLLSPVGC
jgi:hypothetical protein